MTLAARWRFLLAGLATVAAVGAHAGSDLAQTASGLDGRGGAAAHLQAAQVQARQLPAAPRSAQPVCSSAGGAIDSAQALQQLQAAEADWRRERESPTPRARVLQEAVVARACAAYHATRLQPSMTLPVWLYSQVQIVSVRETPASLNVQARARTAEGPVVGSRLTLAKGSHHACFALTDASGSVRCTLIDTHPHGNATGAADEAQEAHEGPLVATLAGIVTPTRVQLPAVVQQAADKHATSPRKPTVTPSRPD